MVTAGTVVTVEVTEAMADIVEVTEAMAEEDTTAKQQLSRSNCKTSSSCRTSSKPSFFFLHFSSLSSLHNVFLASKNTSSDGSLTQFASGFDFSFFNFSPKISREVGKAQRLPLRVCLGSRARKSKICSISTPRREHKEINQLRFHASTSRSAQIV